MGKEEIDPDRFRALSCKRCVANFELAGVDASFAKSFLEEQPADFFFNHDDPSILERFIRYAYKEHASRLTDIFSEMPPMEPDEDPPSAMYRACRRRWIEADPPWKAQVGKDSSVFPAPNLPHDETVAKALKKMALLIESHSNVVAVLGGPKSTNGKWTDKVAIVVVVHQKGVIPKGEVEFPKVFEDALVDVVEGSCQLLQASAVMEDLGEKQVAHLYAVRHETGPPLRSGASIGPLEGRSNVTLGLLCQSEAGKVVGLTCGHALRTGEAVTFPSVSDAADFKIPYYNVGSVGRAAIWEAKHNDLDVTLDFAEVLINDGVGISCPLTHPEARYPTRVIPADTLYQLGEEFVVHKWGRTTWHTAGTVTMSNYQNLFFTADVTSGEYLKPGSLGAAVDIVLPLPSNVQRAFYNQVVIKPIIGYFSLPGDSGSLVVAAERAAAMLIGQLRMNNVLYAVATPLELILDNLGLNMLQ